MDVVMTVIIYYEKENNIFTLEELKNYLISNMCNEYQCFVYSDKNVLLKKIQTEGQYLLFLPVVSENCSGFEIAENVVKNDINAEIIFISQGAVFLPSISIPFLIFSSISSLTLGLTVTR